MNQSLELAEEKIEDQSDGWTNIMQLAYKAANHPEHHLVHSHNCWLCSKAEARQAHRNANVVPYTSGCLF